MDFAYGLLLMAKTGIGRMMDGGAASLLISSFASIFANPFAKIISQDEYGTGIPAQSCLKLFLKTGVRRTARKATN